MSSEQPVTELALSREISRLGEQALMLAAEIAGLRREREELRGLLREGHGMQWRSNVAFAAWLSRIDAALDES